MAEDSAKLLIDVQLVEGAEAVQRLDKLEKKLKNVKDKGKQATLSAKEFDQRSNKRDQGLQGSVERRQRCYNEHRTGFAGGSAW